MSTVPIWAAPAPRTRKPRFTREQIAAAALALADRAGIEALSMRGVADALGAGTMTLYYYVRTKADLMTLIEDALMAEVVARASPLPHGWRAGIEKIARAAYATFVKHRWALGSMDDARLGPNVLRHVEQSLTAVDALALPAATKLDLLSIVDDFVFGTVLRSAEMPPVDAKTAKVINEMTSALLADGDYPRLSAMIGRREPVDAFREFAAQMTSEARFERGLAWLLDGFAAKHRLDRAPPSARVPRRRSSR